MNTIRENLQLFVLIMLMAIDFTIGISDGKSGGGMY